MTANHIGQYSNTTPAEIFEDIDAEERGEIVTIPLPWPSCNRAIGFGLKMGCVCTLAGAPGASKSFMALNICLHAERNGFSWQYLPLEDEKKDWIARAMAVHHADWQVIANPEEDTDEARARLAKHKRLRFASEQDLLSRLCERVRQNPYLDDSIGDAESGIFYEDILDWVMKESAVRDLIVIDPVGFIDFSDNGKDWVGQQKFMKKLTAIVKKTGIHVILVAHIAKRPGRMTTISTLDDLQGSAQFGRAAHYVLLLDRHDSQDTEVYSAFNTTTSHKLTLSIAKARGGFSGTRIAMDLDQNGPVFREYGIIKPANKRSKGRAS